MYLYLYAPEYIASSISKKLENVFSVKVIWKGYKEVPSWAFNEKREQCYAPALLSLLNEKPCIWIIDIDIYTNGMNFIFGIAGGGRAIVSSYRLDSIQMIEKEVIHEIGHVFGLSHCKNRCVMQFSNCLEEAMEKPSQFCQECIKKLRDKINI